MAIQDIQAGLDKIKNDIATTGIQDSSGNSLVAPNTSGINLPSINPTTQNNSDVNGYLSYLKTQFDTKLQEAKDAQAQKDKLTAQATTDSAPWYSKLLGAKSAEQVRQEATSQTGVNPANYFAQERAAVAELDTLNQDYNKVVAQRDQALADVENRTGGTIDFMNAESTRIKRNAAVVLNQMSSNINSKAATLAAKQGMFNEANTFINNAVNAATADLKYTVDMYTLFKTENKDLIDSLDTKIKDAYKDAETFATNAWTNAVNEKTQVGELMMNNPNAGISINDSLAQAQDKIVKSGGTAAYQLQLAQEKRLAGQSGNTPVGSSIYDNGLQGLFAETPDMSAGQLADLYITNSGENFTESEKKNILTRANLIVGQKLNTQKIDESLKISSPEQLKKNSINSLIKTPEQQQLDVAYKNLNTNWNNAVYAELFNK